MMPDQERMSSLFCPDDELKMNLQGIPKKEKE